MFFSILFSSFFKTLKNLLNFGPRGLLGPTCPISDPNLAPKTDPKSILLGFHDVSYLKISKNVKIVPTLKRKPCLCFPRGTPKSSKNRPKIDLKRDLCWSRFSTPFRKGPGPLPEASWSRSFQNKSNFDSQHSPNMAQNSGVRGHHFSILF